MTTPRLGAPELSTSQANKEETVNETFYWLDAASMGGFAVIDRDLSSPPGSPAQGDCYILSGTPSGLWTGASADDVALYINTAWEIRTPDNGWEAYVIDEGVKIAFSSGSWGIIGTFDGADYIPSSYLDTDDTLAADSDVKVPTQQAVKAYVDGQVGGAVTFATAAEVRTGTETAKAIAPDAIHDAHIPQTLTDGATVTWDMSTAINAKVTLGGNRTLAVSNPKAGLTYVLEVIQDGTGSRTVTWPSSFNWGSAGAPTLSTTAAKVDLVTLYCRDAATPKFRAVFNKDS